MHWVKATDAKLKADTRYLVKTNGGEWRDTDLHVMGSYEIQRKLEPDYVRGRPLYVAEITNPEDD